MNQNFVITHTFKTNKESSEVLTQAESFWSKQGYKLTKLSNKLSGKRGGLFGNITSFDMKKILSEIDIEIKDDEVVCNQTINGIHQILTEWNLAFFKLEMFGLCLILGGRDITPEFTQLLKDTKKPNLIWTLTATLISIRLSPKWVDKIDELNNYGTYDVKILPSPGLKKNSTFNGILIVIALIVVLLVMRIVEFS